MIDLKELGWNSFFENHFIKYNQQNTTYIPARIISFQRNLYSVLSEYGELKGEITGKFRYEVQSIEKYPAVGDWVGITKKEQEDKAIIHFVLPRKTSLSRKMPGVKTEEQVICANIDTSFLVTTFDRDFNLRRIERYLSLIWDSGANPVIILNKADLCTDIEIFIREVESISPGTPILCMSALEKSGIEQIYNYLKEGKTVVFLGSSGTGKSTIINYLLDASKQATNSLRGNSKGRHTTSYRELFMVPDRRGMVIDNPGMREIQLWANEDIVEKTFADIEDLSQRCRFNNCSHTKEPGCAVKEAIEEGSLEPKRLESYFKQKRELNRLSERTELAKKKLLNMRKIKSKELSKLIRTKNKFNNKYK
jgi:ribosome biogenesis GTPase